jgi:4-amino-4-deoxy-L-arabinose transferase-like glycosyltransferase
MRGLPERATVVSLGAVCVLAFAVRAVVIANMLQMGLFADMQEYHDRAVHLLQTGTLPADAFRVPLFSIFIAGIYNLAGQQLFAVRMAHAVLGTLTVGLTYFLARRVVSRRGALFAAFIVAVYPALLLYSVYVMAETLFGFLAILALVLWGSGRWWLALPAGLAVGAATLTRSVGLAVVAGMVFAEVWKLIARRKTQDRSAVLRLALVIGGVAIALAPWLQRNYGIYHRFIPTDTSSGFNVLLGNYPDATGRHPGIAAVESAAQTYWSQARNDLERSDVGMQVGRAFVRENPARAAKLAVLKIGYLFGLEGREHAWGYSHHLQGRRGPRTVWTWGIALLVSFPLLMTLASIGLWRPGLTETRVGVGIAATLIAVTAIHVASFGDSRFHLPWIPLLAILAARAFAPLAARPWTLLQQTLLAMWMVCFALIWKDQAAELLAVLPKLAESPVPLMLPY